MKCIKCCHRKQNIYIFFDVTSLSIETCCKRLEMFYKKRVTIVTIVEQSWREHSVAKHPPCDLI